MNFFDSKGILAIQSEFAPRAQVKAPTEEEYRANVDIDVTRIEAKAQLVQQDLAGLKEIEKTVYN